ncbi:hypothetical protein [Streptomyces sp. NPDC001205]
MSWHEALERADAVAAADMTAALRRPDHWDWVAVRGLVAIVLQALAEDGRTDPGAVPLRAVLEHLNRGPAHVRALAVRVVGLDPAAPPSDESAASTWQWLTRTWPRPSEGPQGLRAQYGGMTRGIGAGHAGAAVDTALPWAARAVERAIEQQLG